ncbi:uncharacterized protein Z519_07529 [Cladophialophora bantiana CBS 173.52]|uniref:Thioredoxin domain-containing protein n=1 Tax=Cladophialophora bantiana (strain ATCC 10958 / CBS 173.52 / CDC B-1940 / NIH 8579) TaxID=1442370 RepID=A0A0D2FYP3_CLAB1|nr:uncharacterized protein Z519_07529 [Cladophialophora bantiana CBS 173.52]KIW91562.1 hypothetical protein Z519_07529 [Cladophialophora bantiana CBS 173.52]
MKKLVSYSSRFCISVPHAVQASSLLRIRSSNRIPILPLAQLFSTTPSFSQKNRVFTPFRTPPQFHDALRLVSANNTLMLALFTTSTCTPCRTITPLLTSLVETRPPSPEDRYSSLAFAEIELDSPDISNGNMMDLGVEYGVRSMPTLMGFGGRRAERVTERLVDTRMLSNEKAMAKWVDEEMKKGDPSPSSSQSGGGGFLARIFGP